VAELVVLDVGHGSAAVLHEDSAAIVVDAGPGTALLEFLEEARITHVRAVLISHADTDHLKGLVALLAQPGIGVDAVWLNSDAAQSSRTWQALVFELDEVNRTRGVTFEVQLVEGRRFELSRNAVAEVLAPRRALAALGPGGVDADGRRISTNTVSAVVRIEMDRRTRVLLAGDLDDVGLDHLLQIDGGLAADVLVFPHHGGNVSASATEAQNVRFTNRLLDAVAPTGVIFSIGRVHATPRPEIVRAVRNRERCRVMCTQMSTHCATDSVLPLESDHLADAFAVGRQRGRCCAGSMRIGGAGHEPAREIHAAFIDRAAQTPLCRRR